MTHYHIVNHFYYRKNRSFSQPLFVPNIIEICPFCGKCLKLIGLAVALGLSPLQPLGKATACGVTGKLRKDRYNDKESENYGYFS